MLACAVVGALLVSVAPAQEANDKPPVEAMLRGAKHTFLARATEKQGEVEIAIEGSAAVRRWQLPKEGGEVTEIVLAPWLGHSLVIAVEMSDAKEDQRYYYWGTVWAGEGRLGQVTSGRILKSRDNFDITGLRNSTGDSIYVVLLRHARGAGEAIFGYVYTNNCPVLPASMHDDAPAGAVRILKATEPPPGMRLGDRWPAE